MTRHKPPITVKIEPPSGKRPQPGWVANDETGRPGWGWASYLLTHLEQDAVKQRIRRVQSMDVPENQAARESVIPVFLCPSEMVPELFTLSLSDGEMDHEDSPDSEDSEIGDEVDEVDEEEHDGMEHGPSVKLARASYVGVFGSNEIEDGIGTGVLADQKSQIVDAFPFRDLGNEVPVIPGRNKVIRVIHGQDR